MNIKSAIIPMAYLVNLDDVAWHDGSDRRYEGEAARSGIPRMHAVEDYHVLEAIGAALDMKILCPLVLCDWDKDNILRGEIGVTNNPHGWDRASKINMSYAKACFEALEGAEHIEYAIHGLNHGRYNEKGECITQREYFPPVVVDGKTVGCRGDLPDFKRRLSLFNKIYNSWGFKKQIRSFASPCGVSKAPNEDIIAMAEYLHTCGIKYWTNSGFVFDGRVATYHDVFIMKGAGGYIGGKAMPWNAFDYDPQMLGHIYPDKTEYSSNIFCGHWANFLRYNPKKNMDGVDAWVSYFKGEAERFGLMLARDIAFSSNQRMYSYFANIEEEKDAIKIDLTETVKNSPTWRENVFYISIVNERTPISCEGGEIELCETHSDFKNYKVTHTSDNVVIKLK